MSLSSSPASRRAPIRKPKHVSRILLYDKDIAVPYLLPRLSSYKLHTFRGDGSETPAESTLSNQLITQKQADQMCAVYDQTLLEQSSAGVCAEKGQYQKTDSHRNNDCEQNFQNKQLAQAADNKPKINQQVFSGFIFQDNITKKKVQFKKLIGDYFANTKETKANNKPKNNNNSLKNNNNNNNNISPALQTSNTQSKTCSTTKIQQSPTQSAVFAQKRLEIDEAELSDYVPTQQKFTVLSNTKEFKINSLRQRDKYEQLKKLAALTQERLNAKNPQESAKRRIGERSLNLRNEPQRKSRLVKQTDDFGQNAEQEGYRGVISLQKQGTLLRHSKSSEFVAQQCLQSTSVNTGSRDRVRGPRGGFRVIESSRKKPFGTSIIRKQTTNSKNSETLYGQYFKMVKDLANVKRDCNLSSAAAAAAESYCLEDHDDQLEETFGSKLDFRLEESETSRPVLAFNQPLGPHNKSLKDQKTIRQDRIEKQLIENLTFYARRTILNNGQYLVDPILQQFKKDVGNAFLRKQMAFQENLKKIEQGSHFKKIVSEVNSFTLDASDQTLTEEGARIRPKKSKKISTLTAHDTTSLFNVDNQEFQNRPESLELIFDRIRERLHKLTVNVDSSKLLQQQQSLKRGLSLQGSLKQFVANRQPSSKQSDQGSETAAESFTEQKSKCSSSIQRMFYIIRKNDLFQLIYELLRCPRLILARDAKQNTLLHLAAKTCSWDTFRYLLEKLGLQSLLTPNRFGRCPLELCKYFSRIDILVPVYKQLIRHS